MTTQELQSIIEFLEKTPGRIERLTDALSDEERRLRPSGAQFSLLENVCHLQDIEREGYAVRIRRLLDEDEPFMPDIDGSRLAVERSYNSQDIGAALSGFRVSRQENVRVLKAVSSEELKRGGQLETVGPITLEELLRMMRSHDEDHLEELAELRARFERL